MLEPLSASRVDAANNGFRYSRPDMYLGAMSFNRQAYIDTVIGKQNMVNTTYIDPSETVFPIIRNLIGTDKAKWHKLAQ